MKRKIAPTKKESKRIHKPVMRFMAAVNITNAPLLAMHFYDMLEKEGLEIRVKQAKEKRK